MKTFIAACLLLIPGTWVFAEGRVIALDKAHSQVEVAVKATMDSFTGHLEDYNAQLTVEAASSRPVSAVFSFKFSDLKTGKVARDEEMNHWLEATSYPNATFTLVSITPQADGRHLARGTLKLHGVEREITFPISVKSDQQLWAVDGEAPLDTREFGLPVFRKFAVLKVSPLLTVRFHLQGTFVQANADAPTSTP